MAQIIALSAGQEQSRPRNLAHLLLTTASNGDDVESAQTRQKVTAAATDTQRWGSVITGARAIMQSRIPSLIMALSPCPRRRMVRHAPPTLKSEKSIFGACSFARHESDPERQDIPRSRLACLPLTS